MAKVAIQRRKLDGPWETVRVVEFPFLWAVLYCLPMISSHIKEENETVYVYSARILDNETP